MPWDILELDQSQATERDVKRAYSRLLKKHRPDRDPEGFRKINAAYKQAKMILKYREEESEFEVELESEEVDEVEPTAGEQSSQPGADSFSIDPRELADAKRTLEDAVASKNQDSVFAAFSRLLDLSRTYPDFLGTIDRSLSAASAVCLDAVIDLMPSSEVLRFLEHQALCLAMWKVDRLYELQDFESLRELADKIIANRERLRNMEAGRVAVQLGLRIAVVYSYTAESLADFAYEHLSIEERDWALHELDGLLPYGQILHRLDVQDRAHWNSLLRSGKLDSVDWSDEGNQTLLKRTGLATDERVAIFDHLLPEEAQRELARYGRQSRHRRANDESGSRSEGGSVWPIGIAIFLLFKFVMLAGTCSSNTNSNSFNSTRSSEQLLRDLEKVEAKIIRERELSTQEMVEIIEDPDKFEEFLKRSPFGSESKGQGGAVLGESGEVFRYYFEKNQEVGDVSKEQR